MDDQVSEIIEAGSHTIECYRDLLKSIKSCCGFMSSSDLKRFIQDEMDKIDIGEYEIWKE